MTTRLVSPPLTAEAHNSRVLVFPSSDTQQRAPVAGALGTNPGLNSCGGGCLLGSTKSGRGWKKGNGGGGVPAAVGGGEEVVHCRLVSVDSVGVWGRIDRDRKKWTSCRLCGLGIYLRLPIVQSPYQ